MPNRQQAAAVRTAIGKWPRCCKRPISSRNCAGRTTLPSISSAKTSIATAWSRCPRNPPARPLPERQAGSDGSADPPGGASAAEQPTDWRKLLTPKGAETRLGQALRQLIHDERNSPVAGVILFTDGGQNAGVSPDAAVALAQEAKIPVFTVGLGSDRQPSQVRVSDLAVPARAYPGDHYTVTGYLQAHGMAGKTVTVQLLLRGASADGGETSHPDAGNVIESRQVTLGGDGELLPVKFELTPEAPGRRTICFRVQARRQSERRGRRQREADIEIVDRKNHVLLLAGGPTREYQFLRNQLYRDHSTTLDVLLQTGQAGHVAGGPRSFSTTSPAPARKCSTTIASWPSIPIGRPLALLN